MVNLGKTSGSQENVYVARLKFFRQQNDGQKKKRNLMNELRLTSASCDFHQLQPDQIEDATLTQALIGGLQGDRTRETLLSEPQSGFGSRLQTPASSIPLYIRGPFSPVTHTPAHRSINTLRPSAGFTKKRVTSRKRTIQRCAHSVASDEDTPSSVHSRTQTCGRARSSPKSRHYRASTVLEIEQYTDRPSAQA